MTGDEIAKLAWQPTASLPAKLSLSEQLLYQAIKYIAWHYRHGLSKDEARRQKIEVLRAFDRAKYDEQYAQKTAVLWNRIDVAAMEFTGAPSIATAYNFYRAVYNLPAGWRKEPPSGSEKSTAEVAET